MSAITTRSEFTDAVRQAVGLALAQGFGEMCWVDRDFADWPLNEAPLIEQLTRWARAPQRRLTMLLWSDEMLRQRHPRFVQWRQLFGHCLDARMPERPEQSDPITLLLAGPCHSVHLLEPARWHGKVSDQALDARAGRELLDAISQRSTPAFAATVLGL